MESKPNKLVLEPLNFADDMVEGAVFKNRSDALFVNLDKSGWARSSPFVV